MKKIKYMLLLMLFSVFIPRVDALTYDLKIVDTLVSNNNYEIKLSLDKISNTDYGVATCTFNVEMSDGVKLNDEIMGFARWSMTKEESLYYFYTVNPVLKKGDLAVIPVSITSNSKITLKNITCADNQYQLKLDDKVIDLKYNDKDEEFEINDSDCDLTDIMLSEGEINFDSKVLEYNIKVNDIDTLLVEPELSSARASYIILKTDDSVIIEVTAFDGAKKEYVLNVESKNNKKGSNKYVPIFIVIICLLVVVNIFRILKNNRNKG